MKGLRASFTKMAKRVDIEDFFEEIDPDLLKYASAFRKCGFSSSITMKYWREQDFQNLEVEGPEGHRRLILNMVTKIRTPELKSVENRSSFMPLTGKVDGDLRKSSVNSRRDISVDFTKVHSTKAKHASQCPPRLRAQSLTDLICCRMLNGLSRVKRMN